MIRIIQFTEYLPFVEIEFISLSGRLKGEITITRKEFKENFNRLELFIAEEINKDISE